PIIFDGFKIGAKIKTGIPLVKNDSIINDPVKEVFNIGISKNPANKHGRSSWDETAMLAAIRGDTTYFTRVPGHIDTVDAAGKVSWNSSVNGQFYLVLK